ncbi:MAG TPA: MFS transporter [Acidimicrobiales bacterium]|nr:MFS transporter [Acidimicrobiales bacterium]
MTSRGSSGSDAPGVRLGLIVAITITGIMGNVLIAPAIPDIVDDFRVPTSAAGWLLAATTAPAILLAPVIGVLADRYGRREVLLPCLLLFGVSGGLSALAPTYPALVGLRLIQGIGSAGLINLAIVLVGDTWDGAQRARMMGRNAAALTASIVVLPPIGGALTEVGGWRMTFAPYWIALATAVLVSVRLPRGRRGDASVAAQVRAVRPLLGSRPVLAPIVLGFVVFVLVFGLFFTIVPFYLDRTFEVGAGGRGLVLALPAVTSTVAALNLGRLQERYALRSVLAVAFSLFAMGFGLAAAVPALWALCAGVLLYGAGEGVTIAGLQNAVAGAAPTAVRGAVVAVWVGAARAGQTLGPVVAAAGLDGPGARATFAGGAVLSAVLVPAVWGLLRSGQGMVAPATN